MEIEEVKIKKIREPDFTPFEKDFVNALYINQFTAKQIKEQLKTEGFDRCQKAIQKLMLKLDANNAISNRKLCGRKKGLGKETKEKLLVQKIQKRMPGKLHLMTMQIKMGFVN